jgi:glycosyltransferase involved in cell wall biosynthesis
MADRTSSRNASKRTVGRETASSPRRIVVATWGDPRDSTTYSGVPRSLVSAFESLGHIVYGFNLKQWKTIDVLTGAIDVRRSLTALRLRRNALWRYYPESIALLSRRYKARALSFGPIDFAVQFGVAGNLPFACPVVAHVERPIRHAMSESSFAKTYGLNRVTQEAASRAASGEGAFLENCNVIWTNTDYTAAMLEACGVRHDKIFVHPPGCGMTATAVPVRDWSSARVLFVGRMWEHKGGPTLVNAMRRVRTKYPQASLHVVGCRPQVNEIWVKELGLLRQDVPEERLLLEREYSESVLFCMPSRSESTGIVYAEAASFGLPIIMSRGQGREELFPERMAIAVDADSVDQLEAALLTALGDPVRLQAMGDYGREVAERVFSYSALCKRIIARVDEL